MNAAGAFVFQSGLGGGRFDGVAAMRLSPGVPVFSDSSVEEVGAAIFFGAFSERSGRKSGNRHLPSPFCGQTTFGLTNDASLITSRLEKREKKAMRRPKFFASRKLPLVPVVPCAMVMPLSFRPLHGVTLTRPIFNVAPKRWRSSCWILACVPCDCTYRFRARKTTAPKNDSPAIEARMKRANFCTGRRYARHV